MEQFEELFEQIRERLTQTTGRKSLEAVIKREKPGYLDCKLGGIPFVPEGGSLPVDADNGNPLFLLAQINFAKIPHIEDYPKEGILQFFIGGDDLYGMDCEDGSIQNSWRVLYFEDISDPMDEKLVEQMVDESFESDELLLPFENFKESYLLEFNENESCISVTDYRFDEMLTKYCNDLWHESFGEIEGETSLPEPLRDIIYKELSGYESRIGGYPAFTQYDPRDEEGWSDYELLLQIDSYGDDDGWIIMWGDSGIANFFISAEDLRNKDFSKVLYNWDCC